MIYVFALITSIALGFGMVAVAWWINTGDIYLDDFGVRFGLIVSTVIFLASSFSITIL